MAPIYGEHKGFLNETHFPIKIQIRTDPLETSYHIEARPFARGKFAQVRRCRHKQTGIEYAGKVIKKRRRSNDVRHEIIHEIAVLLLAEKNASIVNLHEVFETATEFTLILEMVEGGELQRYLDEDQTNEEKDVIALMRQILKAVDFLHNNNIAHLDIKPQNLLLTKSIPEGQVKLCDFGISRLISKGSELREIVGTPDYVAPEILNYEPIALTTDMWSIGVLTYVLLTGLSPFGGDTKQETYSNITTGKLEFGLEFDNISANAIDFIKKLLVKNPDHRMTAKQCLEHRWLQEAPVEVINADCKVLSNSEDSNKENEVNDDYCNDVIKEKNREFFILKMTQTSATESRSVPNTPSCKRFILTSEESSTRSSSSDRKTTSISEKSSSLLFGSKSSLSSYSSSSKFEKMPYHIVFCEDIRDDRVSFIY